VKNDRELLREGDVGFLKSDFLGKPESPSLEVEKATFLVSRVVAAS
jgi:hypothetical protein